MKFHNNKLKQEHAIYHQKRAWEKQRKHKPLKHVTLLWDYIKPHIY